MALRYGLSAQFSRDWLYDQTATDKSIGYGLCMVKSSQDKKQMYKENTHKKQYTSGKHAMAKVSISTVKGDHISKVELN